MTIALSDIEQVLLIFVRITTIVMLAPVFGFRVVPARVKIGISLILTYLLVPIVHDEAMAMPPHLLLLPTMILKEFLVGGIIGFATALLFVGIQASGQFVGVQMGFGIVNVLDPMTNQQISIIGEFQYILALLIFLAIDGHHFLLRAIERSFELVPLAAGRISGVCAERMIAMSADVFEIAIKIGAPVMAALFLVQIATAILARTVPQMNIFIVGFPLKIGVGLLGVWASMFFFLYVFKRMFAGLREDVFSVISALAP